VLKVEQVVKRYLERAVLKGVSFELRTGEIAGLVGANGAGKSTLIKSILGLVEIEEGLITIGPEAAQPGSMEARRMVAYVPELPMLYTDLTAWEHLRYVAMLYGLSEERFAERGERLLRSLHLWDDRHLDPLQMSKGMKQKLSLAAAMLVSPQLLLLDEPFSGLDPLAARSLQALIRQARDEGATILMSTHMLETAERLCDRFLMLYEGQIVGDGTAASLRQQAGLSPETPMDDVFAALCAGGEGQ